MDKTTRSLKGILKASGGKKVLLTSLMSKLKLPHGKKFKKAVKELVSEGLVVQLKGNYIAWKEGLNSAEGVFISHPEGYGFVDIGGTRDVFISPGNVRGAMDGDSVRIIYSVDEDEKKDRSEGIIEEVLHRKRTAIVGKFIQKNDYAYIYPTDIKIRFRFVSVYRKGPKAKDGDLVKASILKYPEDGVTAQAEVIEIIGEHFDPLTDTRLIIEEYGLNISFSSETEEEVEKFKDKITPAELKKRKDLRELKTVTIDGETARDFDDAVSIKKEKKGYRLWVHIADVSHYVKVGKKVYEEALQRGTSVYFPDMVVPMLPEKLSNNLCSLIPNKDRLALTVEMLFDNNGKRREYEIYTSVINSNERMTYTNVRKILKNEDPELLERYKNHSADFFLMEELCRKLLVKRKERGGLDFDLPEPQIIIDVTGKITDVITEERSIANMIIEEFMISANNTVTEFADSVKLPYIYRIHEHPDKMKIEELREFVGKFGLKFTKKLKPKPSDLQDVLDLAKGQPFEKLINHVILRCMMQAKYSPENKGHFGLALEQYCHFTSPIRRFPDLIVHTLIKYKIKELKSKSKIKKPALDLETISRISSICERTAMEAERKSVDLKKVRFMEGKVGNIFTGYISGVTGFGVFVELKDIFIEGLIPLSVLRDDYYDYLEKEHCIVGRARNRRIRIGDRVEVALSKVSMSKRQIYFNLTKHYPPKDTHDVIIKTKTGKTIRKKKK